MTIDVAPTLARAWEDAGYEIGLSFIPDEGTWKVALPAFAQALAQAREVVTDANGGGVGEAVPTLEGAAAYLDVYPELFQRVIDVIRAHLAANGLAGTLTAFRHEFPPQVGDLSGLLECTVALRASYDPEQRTWRSDPVGLSTLARETLVWVGSEDVYVSGHVISQLTPEPSPEFIGQALSIGACVQKQEAGSLRLCKSPVWGGTATFAAGRVSSDGFDWRSALETVNEMLVRLGEVAVYAYVKRGRSLIAVKENSSLRRDWVPLSHTTSGRLPVGPEFRLMLEEEVPDGFGVQLLSTKLLAQLDLSSRWHVEQIGRSSHLVSATDPAAWFATENPPAHSIRSARKEFEPILFTR